MSQPDRSLTGMLGAHRIGGVMLLSLIALSCLAPYLLRLRCPSLYGDDVFRLIDFQMRPLGVLLLRPFNEHIIPFFEVVSWITWQLAGRRLTQMPWAFTLASFVPLVLSQVLLGVLIRQETRSTTNALAAVVLFSLTPVYAETVFWHAANCFFWALCWTLLGLLCAQQSSGSHPWAARIGLLMSAALAPASCAIGLLAGPVAFLYLAAKRTLDRRADRPSIVPLLVPLIGTLLYLFISATARYQEIVSTSLQHQGGGIKGFLFALRAPTCRPIPGLVGLQRVDHWLPVGWNYLATALLVIGLLVLLRRSSQSGLVLVGLFLIFGGYFLTYSARTTHGAHWLFRVERYHLFPHLGLTLILATILCPWLKRFDRRPIKGLIVVNGLAASLLVLHWGQFQAATRQFDHPDQQQTLAALERLDDLCREEGIGRDRCIAALDPVWKHWFQPAFNGLDLLRPSKPSMVLQETISPSEILSRLTMPERQALWGGMDVSRYLIQEPIAARSDLQCLATGRLTDTQNARLAPGPSCYRITGWPPQLEFHFDTEEGAPNGPPQFLGFHCRPTAPPIEIWWASEGEAWSSARCVRFQIDPTCPPGPWLLPLDSLPHWHPNNTRLLRIRVRFFEDLFTFGDLKVLRSSLPESGQAERMVNTNRD